MCRKFAFSMLVLGSMMVVLAACTSGGSPPAEAVERYLVALVDKDEATLSSLSCADWEMTAIMELDSFQAVDTRLEGLTCSLAGTEGEMSLVTCEGRIIATYNNEDQEFDLSLRTYQVVEQSGEYLVCGFR
ncbi:MAG: hypothetical protein JXB85_07345 [Anaerolineales bacterium]|nr:hypothetical protein [Anaerolineales bacterium]